MKPADYETLVFDCDGVILDSNQIKTQAFYRAALPYGHEAAEALAAYHVQRGGISRYLKFAYFLTDILGRDEDQEDLRVLLANFAEEVKKGLLSCPVADGLAQLREHTKNSRWLIISGGDQEELREVFAQRNLMAMFDGGIFGSPANKDEILAEQLERGNISHPALFFGDSKYDLQAAHRAGLDFIFISDWSEVPDWQDFCRQHNVPHVPRLSSLIF